MTNQVLYERWKTVTKLHQHIWKRWSQEYLNLLQQRSRWTTQGQNPSIGELVIVKDATLPPQKWSLGRIVQLHPGTDGIVRIVSVKYRHDVKKRPVNKLCQLPISILSTGKEDSEIKATTALAIASNSRSAIRKRSIPQNYEDDEEDMSCTEQDQFIVRDAIQAPSSKRKKMRTAPCTWAKNLLHATLLMLYWMTVVFGQGYEIIRPKAGFYIENLGYAKIKRGNLRLQISLPINEIINDQKIINSTWTQIHQMCEQTRKLTQITTHCDAFFKHLSVKRHDLLETTDEIQHLSKHHNRSKRGLLGTLLTNVFGVNDEIYKEIESLQSNQHTIAQLASQQALYLNTKINQTNFATESKLKQFGASLSQVVDSINEMANWYSQADHNRISIEVLAAYLSAQDYFNELEHKYDKWRNAIHEHGHILDFITTYDIKKTIERVSGRMDSNMFITRTPQRRLDVKVEHDTLTLYGYLNIVERSTYALVHVTPIPHLVGNNSLVIAELTFLTLAVNFNEQSYFNLEQGELKSCVLTGNYTYICMPTIVHNIDGVPSCVIDEIYGRLPKTSCNMQHMQLNGIIWKALMMKNTWLYVTTESKVIAIICKGMRTEILLNTTGIIRLDDDCVIKSKETTLKTTIDETIEVISSHIKEGIPIVPHINDTKPLAILRPGVLISPDEHVYDYSIQPVVPSSGIAHKITIGSMTTSTAIMIIVLLYIGARRYWSKISACFKGCQRAPPKPTPVRRSTPGIEGDFNRVLASAARQHVQP